MERTKTQPVPWMTAAATLALALTACPDSLHLDPVSSQPAGGGGSGASGGSGGSGGADTSGTTTSAAGGGSGGSGGEGTGGATTTTSSSTSSTTTTSSSTGTTTTGSGGEGGGGGGGGAPPGECVSNQDCAYPEPICDTIQHECVECLELTDCTSKPETVCSQGACTCPGPGDTWCPAFGGHPDRCVDLESASADCGACDHACFGACTAGKCADQWEPTAQIGAPTPRARHVAVWTGTHMVVWGGQTSNGPTNTGAMYELATGKWTSMTTVNAPSARTDATAVWSQTGKRVIVWGGGADGSPVGTGGVFDPATNTWKTIATEGAPSPRLSHSAVWNDAAGKMLVAGGSNGTTAIGSGAAYTLGANTWAGIKAMNTARREHVTVWTGELLILHGGIADDDTYLTGGEVYSVANDTWTPLDTKNQPSARARHAGIWTGEDLVVWGGANENGLLSDGAKYSYAQSAWAAMSDSGAPGSRERHTAVWFAVPKRMAVWGGEDGTGPLGTGALFYAPTNQWDKPAMPTAPAPRSHHTAVEANGKMIVWGGQIAGSGFTNTGGIFTPQ